MSGLRVRSLRALVFRAPIARPVTTSFGTMYDRPRVLARAEDGAGRVGWGEIWCNLPAVGPEVPGLGTSPDLDGLQAYRVQD